MRWEDITNTILIIGINNTFIADLHRYGDKHLANKSLTEAFYGLKTPEFKWNKNNQSPK